MAGITDEIKKSKVAEIFHNMSYGSVSEADSIAKGWIQKREVCSSFINGKWHGQHNCAMKAIQNPCTQMQLGNVYLPTKSIVQHAVKEAEKAYSAWSSRSSHDKAKYLYSIARNIQKHQQLMAVLESIDSGKPIHKTKEKDVPNLIRSFYHYAGWSALWDIEMKDWQSLGVVGIIVEEYNNPLMTLCWRVSSILAAGNTVVLMPHPECCLSALLFAEICTASGLPPGVLNIVPGDQECFNWLCESTQIAKLVFVGSFETGKKLRETTAILQKDISLDVGGRPTAIVLDGADIHSAADGIVEMLFFNDTRSHNGGCRVLVQDDIKETFLSKLKSRFTKVRVSCSTEKGDMTSLVTPEQHQKLEMYIKEAKKEGGEAFQLHEVSKTTTVYPPTVLSHVQTASRIVSEEIGGPLIAVIPFRTVKEAIAVCNQNKYGSCVSIWTEKLTVALEVAHRVKSGTVWINCQNEVDAAAGYGGIRHSGSSREGGKEGLFQYVKPTWRKKETNVTAATSDYLKYGENVSVNDINLMHSMDNSKENVKQEIDHTFKLYYGGQQKRPDGNTSRAVFNSFRSLLGYVAEGNRKDIRNAVECAQAVQPKWEKTNGHNRAQILYYIGENLEMRKKEFASDLSELTGVLFEQCVTEVDLAVQRLFFWAAYCDKYGGTIQETQMYGKVLQASEAIGVIAVICPDDLPLLSFISLIAPAISRGNAVVVVPSEKFPIPALKMYQVFDTSDVPGGVVNIVSGNKDHLTRHLALHQDIEAIWFHSSCSEAIAFIQHASARNLKNVWIGGERDWKDLEQGQGLEFLLHSTQNKTIWLPMGDIFAN